MIRSLTKGYLRRFLKDKIGFSVNQLTDILTSLIVMYIFNGKIVYAAINLRELSY